MFVLRFRFLLGVVHPTNDADGASGAHLPDSIVKSNQSQRLVQSSFFVTVKDKATHIVLVYTIVDWLWSLPVQNPLSNGEFSQL